ncbi:SOS response-associated peptidase family protein [Bradyrhizobium viridifuturi]|uniref:SOS response-associated peptidase n=1 Tax=uncultured Bradyrhizobium sp. TaxID=199684 RepID=UPI001BA6CA74|nr:SOS response-associated peptidase family protein [uncultured Bradyrhizobium sp.]MBR1041144.1 SOS response-associated peptidase family protein [Bradyrhizobium viridifuturi]MBR1075140.1 SOS response-associated peptidase family protein [Bradyrhizobium viridifuturi]
MCNDYEQHILWHEYCQMMQALELGVPTLQSERDLPIADDIRINDLGPVMRAAGNGVELAAMNFGFPPSRPRASPVFNFRSEKRSFENSHRCLIPASAFFEFTGQKYPKAKHRFSLNDAAFMAIAGIWREGKGDAPPAFTMLTTSPGPDVEPYHDRQVVVLRPSDWAHWIYLTRPERELLRPLPVGSLQVETVRPGKDKAGPI